MTKHNYRMFTFSPARCALTAGLVLSAAGAAHAQVAPAPATPAAPAADPIIMKIADMVRREMSGAPKLIEPTGYIRSGTGFNFRGGDQVAFQAPGAYSKYRLGNETELYGEFGLKFNWVNPDHNDGAWFSTVMKMAIVAPRLGTFDQYLAQAVREAYVQGGHVIDSQPDMTFWAGQRFYRRKDVHIIDFFFQDMSGYGGGFEDLKLGDKAKLAAAWLIGSTNYDNNAPTSDFGKLTKHSIDIRIYDIPAGPGSLELWLVPTLAASGSLGSAANNRNGFAGGVFFSQPFMGGFNEISAEFGIGGAANLSTGVDRSINNNGWLLRVLDRAAIQLNAETSMMYTALIQLDNKNGDANGTSGNRWISFGARPIHMFSKHVGMAVEGGVDIVTPEGDGAKTGVLGKLTVAGVIRPGAGFWERPELRLFLTGATWNDSIKGAVGGPAYSNDTFGMTGGVQAEMWW
jgi:maltoporin